MDALVVAIDLGGSKMLATAYRGAQALGSAKRSTDPTAGADGLAAQKVLTAAIESVKTESVVTINELFPD